MKNVLEMICQKLAPEKGKLDEQQRQEFEDLMRTIIDLGLAPGKEKPNEEEMREIMQAEIRKITEAGMKKAMELQIPLQRGLLFVFTLPAEADAHYAGGGVSLGAADTPTFWYRPKDSEKYRVIYADLSVRDADTPPNVPNAKRVPDLPTPGK